MTSTALMIGGRGVRRDSEGRYCLNDCHKASGAAKKNGPAYWRSTDTAQALEAELRGDTGFPVCPISTVNDGFNNGTYAVKELVYAYAMWISPSFHLQVIRAFDGLVTGQIAPAPQFPVPKTFREALLLAADLTERAEIAEAQRESPFHPISPPLAPLHPALPTRRQGLSVPPHGQGQRRRLPDLQPH